MSKFHLINTVCSKQTKKSVIPEFSRCSRRKYLESRQCLGLSRSRIYSFSHSAINNKFVKILSLFFISIFFFLEIKAQSKLSWDTLADYDFEMRFDEESELYFRYPLFSEKIKKLEKKYIHITGYMIPVDVESNYYVLSAFPFANCFFCGGAGPETVIELELKPGHRRFKTDERLTFKGEFQLNSIDAYSLSYRMLEAELMDTPKEE